MKRTNSKKLSASVEKKIKNNIPIKKASYKGDTKVTFSTGSTLLNLAITGGRIRGGGIPSGILVEIFGASGSGKTVLLSEIAGDVQRKGGEIMFHDPEARLDKQFARIFDLDTDTMNYSRPDTIPEVFSAIRNWNIENKKVNGIFADSLAALSTNLEMTNDDGDKMGMRRAKEFSEELRKTCRILAQKNLLLVCSNQVRQNMDAGPYGQKYISPGGQSIGFYSSLRLRTFGVKKIKIKKKIKGKEIERVIGINVNVEVYKSSVWKPYYKAPLTILFDYGIDDIRENLQYIKQMTGSTMYCVNEKILSKSMNEAIEMVEEKNLVEKLKTQVIDTWENVEKKFIQIRQKKKR